MQIRYVGPHDEVEVPDITTGLPLVVAARGAVVEVGDDLGARLIEQTTWEAVEAPAPAPAVDPASTPGA